MRSTCIFIELCSYVSRMLSSINGVYLFLGGKEISTETSQSVRRLGILFTPAHLKMVWAEQNIHTIGPKSKYHRQTKTLY